jgi:diguanylate cyclase (GGDEF)-like protein
MSWRLRFGIRQKVVLILTVTLLSGLAAESYFLFAEQARIFFEESERRGRELSHFIGETLAYHVVAYDYHTVELRLKGLLAHEEIVYAGVLGPQGGLMSEVGAEWRTHPDVRLFEVPIELNGERIGHLTLGLNTSRLRAMLESQRRQNMWRYSAVILFVLIGKFAALTFIVIRPITRMARALHAQGSAGNSTTSPPPRLPVARQDELGEIATEFNNLLDRLDRAQRALEARVATADRELERAYEQLARQAEILQQKNAELEALALTDPLTGLYNKRYFERLMASEVRLALREGRIQSLMLLDIAHFKQFNERYGLRYGDHVLAETARRLAARTRRSDVLCRFGGDEFVLLLRGATAAEAVHRASELHEAVCRQPIEFDGLTAEIGLSIGIATYPCPQPIDSAEALFACADEALRAAKRLGRNRIVHSIQLKDSTPPP